MTTSKSLQLPPNTSNPGSIFLKSQLCATPAKLPKDTNLTGKVAIVTGGSTGLGFHACIHLLAFKLSHLIIGVRSIKKGEDAASILHSRFPGAKIEVWELEMSSYEAIQSFVRRVENDLTRLDIAILNAGLVKQEFGVVKSTGHEESIQVNYLSTVLLSILILPTLKAKSPASTPGRLSIVGSGTALVAKFPNRHENPLLKSFDNPTTWDNNERYPSSKLLFHYFMVKFAAYIDPNDVIVNIVDPGLCKGSGLLRDVTGVVSAIYTVVKAAVGRKMELGSTTYIDATVVKGAESHGCFVMDWRICPFAALVYGPDGETVGQRLWDETMQELAFAEPLKVLEGMKRI
ncbi:Short chain dehydrogenase yanD [Lachnellula cervina]|uniref:Short chain dehydrogenase yanD n=1 Tax=Lachnellula cervina TaxID=1316786 RepID=A0A7D8Z422_9HELO|nr:Short chain dehydrogenase yanD [Lachnellula cervina]